MTDPRVPVLLYDGECSLCNGMVRFLLRHDSAGRLHFAPLQSGPAQNYLRAQGLPTDDFDSLVFVRDWSHPAQRDFLRRTDGALAAIAELEGGWQALAGLRVVPPVLRDSFYKIIAKTRYALFGKYRPKPLEQPAWEQRFLAH